MPAYPYLGTEKRFYGQYQTPGGPLWAEPGGSYDMWPVPGSGDPAVPPGDGRWGEPPPEPGPAEAAAPELVSTPAAAAEEA